MSVTIQKIVKVRVELRRFGERLSSAERRLDIDDDAKIIGSPETAAAIRASMDLTRVLADFRR